jgi:histidine triad (HIT) family protein
LPDQDLARAMVFAKVIARAIRKVVPCKKVGVAVLGLETKHAHLHLVPISSADDLNFTRSKLAVTAEALSELTSKIKTALATK